MSGFFSHQSIGKALLWYECFSERILPSILAPLGLFFSKECCSLSFLSYMRHRHATTILTHTQYICNNCGKPHIDSTPATLEPKSCWNLILIFLVKLSGVVLRFDCAYRIWPWCPTWTSKLNCLTNSWLLIRNYKIVVGIYLHWEYLFHIYDLIICTLLATKTQSVYSILISSLI